MAATSVTLRPAGPATCIRAPAWTLPARRLLSAGSYTLALTQSGNFANCADFFPGDLSCGFARQGQGNYTPGVTGDPGCTAFCGTFDTQENGDWAVDILNVNSASAITTTPEPVSMLLAGVRMLPGTHRAGQTPRHLETSGTEIV